MALPPEKVKIKRKKDEDPVEALYIAPEDEDENPKKRRHTEFFFRRLRAGDGAHTQNAVGSSGRAGSGTLKPEGIPQIDSTLPGEGAMLDIQDDRSLLHKLLAEDRSRGIPIRSKDRPDGSTAIGLQKPETQKPSPPSTASDPAPLKNLQPRRFHLSKSSPVTPFPRSPVSGVHKRKKGALKNEVAIFIEKERRQLKRPRSLLNLVSSAATFQLDPIQRANRGAAVSKETAPTADIEMSGQDITSAPTPRKRPLISTREKQRLAEQSRLVAAHQRQSPGTQKTAQTIHADPNLWDYDSPHLVAELQEIVLHSIGTQAQSSLKYKPKAPPARLHEREAAEAAAAVTANNTNDADVTMQSSDSDSDDEDVYVYDTYVREPRSLAPELDSNNDGAKIGVLVIKLEDRAEWEAFADDDDESDNDFSSDQEDENAECFYANDYPEDEVDPEDEYDRGAYEKFRTGNASDEEEFDTLSWSGGNEGEGGYEWLKGGEKGEGKEEGAEDEDMG
ncbi:MAG: hypothetical protein M1840_006911 [Geoglossum simile]|nr:MAG: hypothetical protein M1840_006911 [Geoglossum simile]